MLLDPTDPFDHFPPSGAKLKSSMILQSMLSRFEELKESKREFDELRQELIELKRQDATQEEGDLSLSVKEQSRRILSFPKLAEVVGEEEALEIRDKIEKTTCFIVTVRPTRWA